MEDVTVSFEALTYVAEVKAYWVFEFLVALEEEKVIDESFLVNVVLFDLIRMIGKFV